MDDNEELCEHHRFVAEPGQKPLRVDKYLSHFLDASRNKVQAVADAGNIHVNGAPVKSNYKVKPGDVVAVVMSTPLHEISLIPEDIPLDIVYEDDDVVVVNKPAGLVVHPGYGNYTGTLVNALIHYFGNLPAQKETNRPGLVHRIDKLTSGLMVVARNELAMAHLSRQFFYRTIERRYLALVWGDFEEDSGTITGNIGRSLRNRKVQKVFPKGDQGKYAVTHWEVVERLRYVTLISCELATGRTHQIRVHLSHEGHPLFGDPEYGGNKILRGTTSARYKQFVQNCFRILSRQGPTC